MITMVGELAFFPRCGAKGPPPSAAAGTQTHTPIFRVFVVCPGRFDHTEDDILMELTCSEWATSDSVKPAMLLRQP